MKAVKRLSLVLMLVIAFGAVCPAGTMFSSQEPLKVAAASAGKKPKINKTKYTMAKKQTLVLKITKTKKSVKWSRSNKKIKLKKLGKYSVKVTAKSTGKVSVYAKTSGKTLKCRITIKKSIPTKKLKVKISSSFIEMGKGKTKKLKVTTVPENATDKITWSSSNKKAVKTSGGKITGVDYGFSYVTVKSGKAKYMMAVLICKPKSGAESPDVKVSVPTTALDADRLNMTISNNGTKTLRIYAPFIYLNVYELMGVNADDMRDEDMMYKAARVIKAEGKDDIYQQFDYLDIAPNSSVDVALLSKNNEKINFNSAASEVVIAMRYDTRYYSYFNAMGISMVMETTPIGMEEYFKGI